jgi:alpha-beta hydrolase superfamily lysophospholipase
MMRAFAVLAVCLLLAACASPAIQPAMTPPPGFAGPSVEARALVMDDGARLPLTRWTPAGGEPWAVIVALHGLNDARESFRLAGPWWAEHGIETWAYDGRGFGQAPGRGVWPGEARMTQDLRVAVSLARARRPHAIIAVVGESMGGSVAAAAAASNDPPDADRTVLMAPGVWGWSSQDPLNKVALWIAARAMGETAVEPPAFIAEHIQASSNRLELFRNGRDPSSILATRFDAISGLVDLMQSASDGLGRTAGPTLLMYGAHDQIVEPGPMRKALERAGEGSNLRTAWYPDGWHLLNRDLAAETVYRDIEAWLRDPAGPLPSGAPAVLAELQRPRR